jgi:ribosome-binding protein aMBF1 (putative translation factor)
MAELQIIRTPDGEELVVLPRAEYDALLARLNDDMEDDEDVAIYDARKAAAAIKGETPLPAAVSAAMLKGDSLLRATRRWRGLSQTEVSERCGISQGYLSDLESRRRKGGQETLAKLAAALDVPADWLAAADTIEN